MAQEELHALFANIIGEKTLMIDPSIIGPLALIIPLSVLISKMSVSRQIYRLDDVTLIPREELPKIQHLVILTRPRIEYMRTLSRLLQFLSRNFEQEMKRVQIHLFFVPRRTMVCELYLEKSAIYHMFTTIGEYSLDLIPFDNNLMFLELPQCHREWLLEGDNSSLYFLARSIIKLESCYGLIPKVKWCGRRAELVWRMVRDMTATLVSSSSSSASSLSGDKASLNDSSQGRPGGALGVTTNSLMSQVSKEVDEIVLFDRQVDYVSCLVTGLTYESLIDQVFGSIKNNMITIEQMVEQKVVTQNGEQGGAGTTGEAPSSTTVPPAPTTEKSVLRKVNTKVPLNDDDSIYYQTRHLNFLSVGAQLQVIAREIEALYEQRKSLKQVKEIKEYMKKVPELQQKHKDLSTHLTIASKIKDVTLSHDFRRMIETEQNLILQEDDKSCMEYIEMCIMRQDPLEKVLRLCCLMSLTRNGLSQKEFDHLRNEIVVSYGHFTLLTLDNLQRAGLLTRNNTSRGNSWKNVRNAFNLMVRELDEKKQDDIAYVHSGYAPLSVRIIQRSQATVPSNNSTASSAWTQLENGKNLFLQPNVPVGSELQRPVPSSSEPSPSRKKRVLCVFVGGVTKCEVNALRSMERNSNTEYIVVSTNGSGERLISELIEAL